MLSVPSYPHRAAARLVLFLNGASALKLVVIPDTEDHWGGRSPPLPWNPLHLVRSISDWSCAGPKDTSTCFHCAWRLPPSVVSISDGVAYGLHPGWGPACCGAGSCSLLRPQCFSTGMRTGKGVRTGIPGTRSGRAPCTAGEPGGCYPPLSRVWPSCRLGGRCRKVGAGAGPQCPCLLRRPRH